ncbi:uncharacterized protein LOC127004154 isoform X3 [Eriocheir sinensis]|uniref:uncharacterized protein LOC127004154 isoform X3 n=1 Tax=Eriocheir sinensis TaxID=95602 RepID=UPI0021C6FE7D|nr:uncharacterized protein LOC127004154 isoform X3 [Eriocheir sinensis]
MKPLLILGMLAAAGGVCKAAGNTSCNPGWELCPITQHCVHKQCMQLVYQEPPGYECKAGFVYCEALAACVEPCRTPPADTCSRPAPLTPVCPTGHVCCQKDATTKTCTTPEDCQRSAGLNLPSPTCPESYVFCVAMGGCVLGGCPEAAPAGGAHCDLDKVYCPSVGRCVEKNECDGVDVEGRFTCPPGKPFCVATGRCEDTWACGVPLGDNGGGEICPPHKPVFCLASRTCEVEGGCRGRPPETMASICPRGYIYCAQRGECVARSRGCTEPVVRQQFLSCPHGTTFSIPRGICVPEPENGRLLDEERKSCPPGTVLSLSNGVCVPDPAKEKKRLTCPPGTVYHLTEGTCVPDPVMYDDVPSWACPMMNESRKGSFTYSTCITSEQCSTGLSCCPDPETWHFQCVNMNGEQDAGALNKTCQQLEKPKYDTTVRCNSPEECPQASVCCGGKCRSHDGVTTCPIGTLFCSATSACVRIGKPCGKACPPKNVFCLTSQNCGTQNSCGDGNYTSGAPWMMPDIKWVSEFSNNSHTWREVLLSETYKSASTGSQDRSLVIFTVTNLTTAYGMWFYRGQQSSPWMPIEPVSEITPAHYVQYRPLPNLYEFGLDYINMTEAGTEIKRTVVQLLAPESPSIQVERVVSTVTTEEDVPKQFSLWSIVNVTCNDTQYWKVWMQAADFPKQAVKGNLLQLDSESVMLWVTLLQSPGLQDSIGEDGVMGRGLTLEWVKRLDSKDERLADLFISLNEGKEWFRMNPIRPLKLPVVSCDKMPDVLVKVQPTPNAYGTAILRPSVYPSTSPKMMNETGSTTNEDISDIVLQVTGVNDLPVARTYPEQCKVASLRVGQPNTGVPVEMYAEAFFQDPENNVLGIIILQAFSSPDGDKWQYSIDSGKTFVDVNGLQKDPFSVPLSVRGTQQGPVRWRKEMEKVKCNFRNLIDNLDKVSSGNENSSCLKKTKRRMGNKQAVARSRNISTRIDQPAIETAGVAQFEYGTGNISLTGNDIKVEALYLPPTTLLRYETSRPPWTKEAAFRDTRLVFVVLDTNSSNSYSEVQWMNISLKEDLGKNGIGKEPVATAMTWQDCTGQCLEMLPPQVMDACGQCGGDNTTCTDCAGVLNGSATIVCGECVGGTTNKVGEMDCAGQCEMQNHIVNINGEEVCQAKNATFCDGSLTSGAYFNRCGVCVGGTTGLEESEGLDNCGVCYGDNNCIGCDNAPNSGKVLDRCGLCLKPVSPLFDNCLTLMSVTDVLDAAVNDIPDISLRSSPANGKQDMLRRQLHPLLTVKAQVTGLTAKKYTVECWLEVDREQTSNATHVQYSNGQLKATFQFLVSGIQSLKCTFIPEKKKRSSGMTLESLTMVEVVDSRSALVETDTSLVETSSDRRVTLSVKNAPTLDSATCVLLYQDTADEGNERTVVTALDTKVISDDQVSCTITKFTRPGEAQIGVVLTAAALKAMYLAPINLQTKPITIMSPAPEVVSAVLNRFGDILLIKFDQKVEFEANCSNIISWPWKSNDADREAPTCQVLGDKVKIRLSPDINLEANTSLTFVTPGSIRSVNGNPSNAPSASGSFMVLQPKAQNEVTFHLTGDTRACNASEVTVSVTQIRGARIQDLQPVWNITWEPTPKSQAETNLVWQSLTNLRDAMKQESRGRKFSLTLPGNEFLEGVEYMIVVHLVQDNEEVTNAKSLTVTTLPADQPLRVTVIGPSMVMADQPNSFQAKVTSCLDTIGKSDTGYKFTWRVLGSSALTIFQGRRITIPPNVLRVNQNQTLVVNVMAPDLQVPGTGNLDLSVIPQGISAVMSSSSLRVCANTAITIDASNSKDRDNRPGPLSYRWRCSINMNKPCIVMGNPQKSLEGALPEEEMSRPTLRIPAGYLPPGSYNLTLVISKGRSSTRKNVKVEIIRSGCEITIQTEPTSVLVNPQEEVIIPGYVTGPSDLNVQWQSVEEPGSQSVEMMPYLDSGQPVRYEDPSEGRQHFLRLPKPQPGLFAGLMAGETYKFRIQAWTNDNDKVFNDVILKTPQSHVEGKVMLQVSPLQGNGILDNFTFTMKNSMGSMREQPFSVYFGYRFQDSQDVWFTPTTSDEPTAIYQLPARSNQEKVIPVVKVCDAYGICQKDEGDSLTLNLPSQLPSTFLVNIAGSFVDDMKCDDCLKSALKQITDKLATIVAMNYSSAAATLNQVVENTIISELPNIMARMQNNPSLSLDVLDGLLGFVQKFGASPELKQLWGTLAWESFSNKFGLPPPVISYSSPDTRKDEMSEEVIYFPKTMDDLENARNGYKPNAAGLSSTDVNEPSLQRRTKRQTHSTRENLDVSKPEPMTVGETRVYLKTFETLVNEATSDTVQNHLKNLLNSLPLMLSDLCRLTTSAPKQVVGDLMSFTVTNSDLKNEADSKFFFEEKYTSRADLVEKNSFVVFGDVLLDYEQWPCKESSTSETSMCYGACLSTVLLQDDFWSVVTGARTPGSLRTSVAGAFLLNPETGVKVPVTSNDRITYNIKINNSTKPSGYRIECYGWNEQEWDDTICNTGTTEVYDDLKKMVCHCKKTVYVAGFLVKFSVTPKITAPSIEEEPADQTTDFAPPPNFLLQDKKHVTIIIFGNYDEVVGNNKTKLEEMWAEEFAITLGIPVTSIYNLTISRGSIQVDFDILPTYTRTSSQTAHEVFGNLYELVKTGTITLTGLSNEQLPVLPQALDGSIPPVEEKKDPTRLPLIIGAVVGSIVLIVIVFICFAIYFKNKKKMDKIQPLQMGETKQPTYSSIHFEQMLDGTIASLAKHRNASNRSLSSGGSYADEGIYIERRSTPSSRGGSGTQSSGKLSHDSGLEEVPEAFLYQSPSKEQLESSGPIPEHIDYEDYDMRGLRLGHALPGKPDYLLFEEDPDGEGGSARNPRGHGLNVVDTQS